MSSGWKSHYMALIGLLARRRKELRVSQIDLAKQLKVGRRSFQRWEGGRVEPPAKRLFQWAAALGVTIAPHLAQSSADATNRKLPCAENPSAAERVRQALIAEFGTELVSLI